MQFQQHWSPLEKAQHCQDSSALERAPRTEAKKPGYDTLWVMLKGPEYFQTSEERTLCF